MILLTLLNHYYKFSTVSNQLTYFSTKSSFIDNMFSKLHLFSFKYSYYKQLLNYRRKEIISCSWKCYNHISTYYKSKSDFKWMTNFVKLITKWIWEIIIGYRTRHFWNKSMKSVLIICLIPRLNGNGFISYGN